jgi:hypothetical protein
LKSWIEFWYQKIGKIFFPNSLVRKLPREVSDHNPPYSLFWAMSKLKTFAIQV